MSHATTVSPKSSFRAPWKPGDAVVGRGNAGWTWKSGHPCPCQNCSQGPPAEKTGIGTQLNHPSCPPDALIGQETELIEPKDTNYLDEWPNMSTHNFCHQTLNISQSKHKRDDHVLHAFTITVSLISFRPDLPHLLSQFTNDWTKESYWTNSLSKTKEYLIIDYDCLNIWNMNLCQKLIVCIQGNLNCIIELKAYIDM